MRLFLDTSALVARHNKQDVHHDEAVSTFNEIGTKRLEVSKLYCSDFVFDESVTACRMRTKRHDLAVELGEAVLTSKSIIVLQVDAETLKEAWEIFKRHKAIPLSFTDCTTVALARKNGIFNIFTFDEEFDAVGLHRIP